jgi:gamma-glutamylcyclotransferase (GGCT)/AIG2-like uncharacterized protein YtfP
MYYVLGYGALTDPVTMLERCPSAVYAGIGTLDDHELYIDRCSSVRPAAGEVTKGVVWKINNKDMTALDGYEGYPYLYERKEVDVNIDNRLVKVWVYYYAIDFKDMGEPASNKYYKTCKKGYKEFGLPFEKQFGAAQKKCRKKYTLPRIWVSKQKLTKTKRTFNKY